MSEAFDGAAAICLSYQDLADSEARHRVFIVFTHQEVRGKTWLCLQIGDGEGLENIANLERAHPFENAIQTSEDKCRFAKGYTLSDLSLVTDGSTMIKVAFQELDVLGDAVWELRVARHAVRCTNNNNIQSITTYKEILDENSAPLERLEFIPRDKKWMQCLPAGCTVVSAVGHGSSLWSQTGRIEVRLQDGSIKDYFIKLTETVKRMSKGEHESMRLLHMISPDIIPKPLGYGILEDQKETSFFLCEFLSMHDEVPNMRDLCSRIASLHLRSQAYSPNGQFGFHVTTCNGTFPQYTKWSSSWERFYIESLKEAFTLEEGAQGHSQEIADLMPAILEKVCPRLLRPLETEGRDLKPTLVHGDVWDRNTGILMDNNPCVFDAAALWAHNEYELHTWRDDTFKIGKDYAKEYFKHYPVSPPEEDWEDRSMLYGIITDLRCSYLFSGTDKFRRFLIDNMRTLIEKFPNGYQGQACCKADDELSLDYPP